MNIEKMRQQFEAWATDDGKWPKAVERNGDTYKFMKTHTDWLAWQASRESLVIELPAMRKALHPKMYELHEDCAKAIHAAGVKTK